MADVTIGGADELQKALRGLPPAIAKKAFRKAMRPAMKPVAKSASEAAPKDTGALAQSIKVRAAKRSTKFIGIDVQIGEGDFKGDTWYGAAQEYGTSKMPPKGFMRRAYDEDGDEAKADAIRRLWDIVKEETK